MLLLTVIICVCKPAECTSHVHAARPASSFLFFFFRHHSRHGNFNAPQEERGLFTFMRAHWANKNWRGTCMNYMD